MKLRQLKKVQVILVFVARRRSNCVLTPTDSPLLRSRSCGQNTMALSSSLSLSLFLALSGYISVKYSTAHILVSLLGLEGLGGSSGNDAAPHREPPRESPI